jgi:uncharacterized membrane protein
MLWQNHTRDQRVAVTSNRMEWIMTRVIIWCGALAGALAGGFLGNYFFGSWLGISIGAIAGGFLGSLLGYVAAGLIET